MHQRPYYGFDHTPTVTEMRMRALKAFEDFLSVKWKTPKDFSFHNTDCCVDKRFHYETDKVYAGVPYTDGGKGLFQFWEFYDPETQCLAIGETPEWFRDNIGGTCGCGVMWSLATVCHSLTGVYASLDMVPKHGCLPVGHYKLSPYIDSYREYATSRVIEENGKEVMYSALAHVLPGDMVTTYDNDHTMMCLSPAHTVYHADGTIDPEESYILIRDQRGGYDKDYYDVEQDGQTVCYHGRLCFRFSFKRLLDEYYIPLTTAEFQGLAEYQPPNVRFEGSTETLETFLKGFIVCNYPMAVVKLIAEDREGKETVVARRLQTRVDVRERLARRMPLSRLGEFGLPEGTVKLKAVACVSTGDILTAAELNFLP